MVTRDNVMKRLDLVEAYLKQAENGEQGLGDAIATALERVCFNPQPHEDAVAHKQYWSQQYHAFRRALINSDRIFKEFALLRQDLMQALPSSFAPEEPDEVECLDPSREKAWERLKERGREVGLIKSENVQPLLRNELTKAISAYVEQPDPRTRKALDTLLETGGTMSTGNRALDVVVISWFMNPRSVVFDRLAEAFKAAGGLPPPEPVINEVPVEGYEHRQDAQRDMVEGEPVSPNDLIGQLPERIHEVMCEPEKFAERMQQAQSSTHGDYSGAE